MAYVITLEPEKRLYDKIVKLKNLSKNIAGNQLYLGDEPHLTLYAGNLQGLTAIKAELESLSKQLKKEKVEIKGWFVFKDDTITKKNTLVCELDNKSIGRLRDIQMKVVFVLRKYRKKEGLKRYESSYETLGTIEQENIRKYGFPFVGNIWKPHFSIASFEKNVFDKIWGKMDKLCPKGNYDIVSMNIYSLYEKRWSMKLVKKFEFD